MFDLTITTERLKLRPFRLTDAKCVHLLAGEREIAIMTGSIPHPYPDGAAEAWIEKQAQRRAEGKSYVFAIEIDNAATGSVGVEDAGTGTPFELGYWLGKPYWGRGYMTEAAVALVELMFNWFNQKALIASYVTDNPASGCILHKLGFAATKTETVPHKVRGCDVDIVRLLLSKDTWAAKKV
jgi:[ribosomal protein S5]-alanine N-acetyltransferase